MVSLDVFSLRQEQVWTFSVLDDRIYEMRCLYVAEGASGGSLTHRQLFLDCLKACVQGRPWVSHPEPPQGRATVSMR